MAWNIFPTQNNVGTISGVATRVAGYEPTFRAWQSALHKTPSDSFVVSGLTLSSGGAAAVNIASGVAIIAGMYCYLDATLGLTSVGNGSRVWIYATLNLDGNGNASSITTSWTTGSLPANSVPIGVVNISGGGAPTNIQNANAAVSPATGTYTGDNSSDRLIFLGFTPKFVVVTGDNGTDDVFGLSGIVAGITATPGFAANSSPSAALATVETTRPQIETHGFEVGGNTTLTLNQSTYTYRYLAFA